MEFKAIPLTLDAVPLGSVIRQTIPVVTLQIREMCRVYSCRTCASQALGTIEIQNFIVLHNDQ